MTSLSAIHAGLRQLGIVEEDARDLYERQTGKRSLRDMNPNEQRNVVGELRRLGFKPALKGARKRLEGRYAAKLQALWIDGWNLGIVRDRSDRALIAFVKRQCKIDHVRFLHHGDDANRVIEALKGWLAREGGVDWSRDSKMPDWTQTDGYRVAAAQFAMLEKTDTRFDVYHWIMATAAERPGQPEQLSRFTARDWQPVMNHLGLLVRAHK